MRAGCTPVTLPGNYYKLASMLFVFMGSQTGFAAFSTEPITLTVDAVMQSARGGNSFICQDQITVNRTMRMQWWLAVEKLQPSSEAGLGEEGYQLSCGNGLIDSIDLEIGDEQSFPDLVAEVTMMIRLTRAALEGQTLEVKTVITLQQRTGSDMAGRPVYKTLDLRREVYFLGGGTSIIPLTVTNPGEISDSGTGEVYFRISADKVIESKGQGYGTILVTSGMAEADIFLEGGLVGTVSRGDEIQLRIVSAGLKELSARNAEGIQARKAVRVVPNRTVLVDLSLPSPEKDATPYHLFPLGTNYQGYEEYRRGSDGAVVVMIPSGEFLMGNQNAERSPREHRVWVSDFLMDKTGVTWGQYKQFVEETGIPLPPNDPFWGIHDDHPAVYVTWQDANAYCTWAGGRLPTEAEREKGARGTDDRKFPWGDEEPNPELGVFRRSWGHAATAAVGTHAAGASPYGLLDMGGNVWEWCSDWYDQGYYNESPYRDPKGPSNGISHVVRGGSWDSRPDVLSASCRSWGHRGYSEGDFGFRCAMNVPQQTP
jgi:sulfatase modifying factor 1